MAVTSARNMVNLKEKGHFEHTNENERTKKYTLGDELPSRLAAVQIRSMHAGYTIRKIYPADKELVINFLNRFFFRDEPMNQAVKLLETPQSRCKELEEYTSSSLGDEVSVAAFDDDSRELVGVSINGVVKREEVDYSDKSAECPNEKFARILKVLGHLDREAKIFEKVPPSCNTVLEVRIVSIHSDWRGKGLMKELCAETERLAGNIGAGALRMDATSAFSAAAAERLGYKRVYSVKYQDLSYAPQPPEPHKEARVYIKEL